MSNKRKIIEISSDSDSNSDSDSDSDSNIMMLDESFDHTILKCNVIELFKIIILQNKDKTCDELIDLIEQEIQQIKKKIYNKAKKSTFLSKIKIEIYYCKKLLEEIKNLYNTIENFDLTYFLNSSDDDNNYKNKNDFMNFCFMLMPPNICSKEDNYDENNELFNEFINIYNSDTTTNCSYEYFKKISISEQQDIINKLSLIKKSTENQKPNMQKVLDWNTTDENKSFVLSKLNQFENLNGSSEYFKLKSWINKLMNIPFGTYIKPPVNKDSTNSEICKYLNYTRQEFDNNIYGHEETKDQLIKIIAQTITNSNEGGNVFALQGPPGVGKTAIIHDGISKALNRPFAFISLGGATDSAYLEGFDYTYEGSNHGKIVEVLMQTKCMNPVIYFDELDKVSDTPKGEEIINILMHITDVTQNFCFSDKYFSGISFDLSKVIMIFSFNDVNKVSRILRDRMKIIKVGGYKLQDKLIIVQNYILPKLLKSFDLTENIIKFDQNIIEFIIENYTNEGGVRKLKEIINDILLEVNLRRLQTPNKNKITITKKMLTDDVLKKKRIVEVISIDKKPKVGVVNGLWANSYGMGGLIPIECSWIPANRKLHLELTGMQGKVMRESMIVAKTVAWKILPNTIKKKLMESWKTNFDYGIHIHCPDGSTPKDGPSAGGAITTCLISLLSNVPVNNSIAMTGEINLKGSITAIGGLEEKIFGARKAGVKLILCPKENSKDLKEITTKYPTLIDDDFMVKTVANIWEVLKLVLLNNNITFVKF